MQIHATTLRLGGLAKAADYAALCKPGITAMTVLAAAAGYAAGGGEAGSCMVAALAGTALAAAGAAALNMTLEGGRDALMKRTRNRPVPSGRVSPAEGLILGSTLSASGTLLLGAFAHPLAGVTAAGAVVVYIALYTPAKTRTPLHVFAGAVSGATPPVIGWIAATGTLTPEAGTLFLVMFLWQLPHTLSIAWRHREDCARAGFRTIPESPHAERVAGRRMLAYAFALLSGSVVPFSAGVAGPLYLAVAGCAGATMLFLAVRFAFRPGKTTGRSVFVATLLYLPVVLASLAWGA